MSFLKSIFFPRKKRSQACMMQIDDATHVHTDACFIDIAPLSIAELFQSQGCKSCPPAIPVIHKTAASNPNLLLLTYDVTYWDQSSGWKDIFGQNRWDQRQKTYVKKWGKQSFYTPMVVVDGLTDGVGAEIQQVLEKSMEVRTSSLISVDVIGKELRVTSTQAEDEVHDVLLVVYDAREHVVKIEKGPNKKKKVAHRNVVNDIVKLGEWQGGEAAIQLPEPMPGFGRVVLVQKTGGGGIVTAMKL